MISKFDNCLFVHVPKVAGQSIENVFLERAGLSWNNRAPFLLKPNQNPLLGPPRLAHLTAQEYTELGYLSVSEFQSLYKFAFVRNPWQRILSEYLYRGYRCSFKEFLLYRFPKPSDDNYVNGDDLYRHVIPQAHFLCNRQGNLIVDFVGRFESLSKDFQDVSKKITGIPLSLPHKNKTPMRFKGLFASRKTHCSDYYCEKTEAFVADYYAQDIELFGYTFDT